MAIDNLEPSGNNFFSIQDTSEMGSGSAQLLSNFLSPETTTASPEEIEKIVPKTTEKTTTLKPVVKKEEKPKEDETKPKSLEDQLFGDEEEEEEKPNTKIEKKKESEESEPETNRFTALSKDLLKLGVFTSEEGDEEVDIKNPEEFLARFHNEKQKGAIQLVNDFIGKFGEDYQDAFNAIFSNGVHPKDYFTTYNEIENLSELDLTSENNQKAVIRQFLVDQDFSTEDAEKEIERMSNNGDLESVSSRYHKVLLKKQASKLEQLENDSKAKVEQQKAFKQGYNNNVTTILNNKLKDKVFDGIPLNPSLANEVRDFLVTEKYKTPSGEQLTDFDVAILNLKKPENHEKKVKIGLLLKVLEKDPTLSTIQKAVISKKSDELFSEVQKTSKSTQKSEKNTLSSTSWFS